MELTCPKCHGTMRQYERNSVMIDQCGECRGVFLDRGELDKLIDAEARWADQPQAAPPQAARPQQEYQPQYQQGYGGYQEQPYRQHYYKKHKRRSFLDELFD